MNALQQRWRRWIDERSPPRDSILFTQRNVYILPNKGGMGYAAVVLVLLLAAINEQLNLGYALAFLLGGVGLSAMWLTHGNLRGLSLALGSLTSVHAGQAVVLPVVLDASGLKRGRYGVVLKPPQRPAQPRARWWRRARQPGADPAGPPGMRAPAELAITPSGTVGEAAAGHQQTVTLAVPAPSRGWLPLPRLRIETTYPLGLFTAWGYWRAERRVLVWPALEPMAPPLPDLPADGGGPPGLSATSVDLPDGLRPWRRGDTIRTVAWKKSATRLASGLEPVSREAAGRPRQERWIEWSQAEGLDTEARLSRLATWVVMAERQASQDGQPYGLRLPGLTVDSSQGPVHLQQCLDALAQWGLTP